MHTHCRFWPLISQLFRGLQTNYIYCVCVLVIQHHYKGQNPLPLCVFIYNCILGKNLIHSVCVHLYVCVSGDVGWAWGCYSWVFQWKLKQMGREAKINRERSINREVQREKERQIKDKRERDMDWKRMKEKERGSIQCHIIWYPLIFHFSSLYNQCVCVCVCV